jgi:hypothetical protein
VLFKATTQLYALKKVLESYEVEFEISPTPRGLSSNCTKSIKIGESQKMMVEKLLKCHCEIKTSGIHEWKKTSFLSNLIGFTK